MERYRKKKTKTTKEEFSFEIIEFTSKVNKHNTFSVYAYAQPDGCLYVNGIWIDRNHMKAMADAMYKALEFSK